RDAVEVNGEAPAMLRGSLRPDPVEDVHGRRPTRSPVGRGRTKDRRPCGRTVRPRSRGARPTYGRFARAGGSTGPSPSVRLSAAGALPAGSAIRFPSVLHRNPRSTSIASVGRTPLGCITFSRRGPEPGSGHASTREISRPSADIRPPYGAGGPRASGSGQ